MRTGLICCLRPACQAVVSRCAYGTGEELDADSLRMLLDFVSDRARAEQESMQSRLSQRWLLLGVAIAAAASIVAAIIQAVR